MTKFNYIIDVIQQSFCRLEIHFKSNITKNQRAFMYSLLCFYVLLLVSLGYLYSGQLISFIKTIGNLLDFSKVENRSITIISIFIFFAIGYLLFKSLFEILFFLIFKNFLSLYLNQFCIIKFVFYVLCTFVYLVSSNIYLNHQSIVRNQDLQEVKKVANLLKMNSINFNIYVDKIPELYKRNGFINFKNYCMSFDGLAYKNEPNILIVDQSEPHLLLLTEGYSYAKLTNNIGMYTKHPLILEILEKNNYNLNRTHYYKKNVNLKYLAKMNSLNFVDNKILLKGKGIKRNAREFLLKGNSVITVTLESKTNLPGSSLGEIKIVANKGLVNLYSYTFSKDDFKNGFFNKIIKIKTNNVLHDVVCQIKPFLNAEIYVSNITVEKIKE